MDRPPIHGVCAPGFERVRDAFTANFVERGEVGAAIHVLRGGEPVVDLWGGWVDEERTAPWREDTLVDFYSVGKALVATLLLRHVDAGALTLATPIADVWPEFGRGGKERATVADALCHRAAVPAIRQPMTDADLGDWDTMCAAVAATEAWWPIGTRHAYHTNTYGFLVGEIARRVSGEMPGEALAHLAAALDADVWFGLPPSEQTRCASVIWAPPAPLPEPPFDTTGLDGDVLMNVLAHYNPPGASSIGVVNTPAWRSAQVPSTNGHGTARGVARCYGGLLEDGRVLSASLCADAARVHSRGPCPILGDEQSFGLGFTPTTTRRPLGPNPHSFGHFGTGGALGFGDPDDGIAVGYVMNHVVPRWQSTRNRALVEALYGALDDAGTGAARRR